MRVTVAAGCPSAVQIVWSALMLVEAAYENLHLGQMALPSEASESKQIQHLAQGLGKYIAALFCKAFHERSPNGRQQ